MPENKIPSSSIDAPGSAGAPDETATPYVDKTGTLVIPFACADHRYKFWKQEGEPLKNVLEALNASDEVRRRYLPVHTTKRR